MEEKGYTISTQHKGMMKKCFYTILLTILTVCSATAQVTNEQLMLDTILMRVEMAYPEIQLYDQKIKSINALADGAKAFMPPSFSVDRARFPYQSSVLNENGPMNQAGYMFSLSQMIPNPAKLNARQEYLQSLATVQQNSKAWTINELRSTTKMLFYQRLIAEKKNEIVIDNIDLLKLFIGLAQEKYTYNQTELNVIYKAKARLAEIYNMQTMFNAQVAESTIGLNTLMNRPTNAEFAIDSVYRLETYEESFAKEPFGNMHRSDIKAVESSIKSMALNQKLMGMGRKPDFGISLTHSNMLAMPDQYSIMGMITIPIAPWSSKMYKSEVKSMAFEINAMEKEKETMQLMAQRMSQETLVMIRSAKDQYSNYEEQVIPELLKNLETSLLSYKQNSGSLFVLLDAWEMLLMKKLESLDKLGTVLSLQVEYEYQNELK